MFYSHLLSISYFPAFPSERWSSYFYSSFWLLNTLSATSFYLSKLFSISDASSFIYQLLYSGLYMLWVVEFSPEIEIKRKSQWFLLLAKYSLNWHEHLRVWPSGNEASEILEDKVQIPAEIKNGWSLSAGFFNWLSFRVGTYWLKQVMWLRHPV